MKLNTLSRKAGVATAALAMSVSLAACSSDEEPTTGTDDTTSEEAPTEEAPTEEPEGDTAAQDQTFGPACGEVPADGAGSFNGMVQDPVATAASNNPLLSTLVAAVGAVPGLADTLNTAEGLTVFAPYNPAFEAIPADALNGLLEDPDTLGSILSNHVVAGQLGPEEVVGDLDALNGGTLNVEGDTDGMTVNGATVLCGNVPTANATVYIIDTVLEDNS